MNGYIAFYRGRRTEVHADSSYAAQTKAAAFFKARKQWEVDVVLVEKPGPTSYVIANNAGAYWSVAGFWDVYANADHHTHDEMQRRPNLPEGGTWMEVSLAPVVVPVDPASL